MTHCLLLMLAAFNTGALLFGVPLLLSLSDSRKRRNAAYERAHDPITDCEVSYECLVPPEGWRCTGAAGHDGPCAAVPVY